MTAWTDRYWWSRDGIRLHCRDYPGREDRPPILCVAGLTRNARDFAELADRLAGEWRVIAIELRGRGESGYAKDPISYVPLTYAQDIEALIEELALPRFVIVGTSLGGIVTMLLSATGAERFAGAVLNDVGPVLDPAGLTRIRTYVGKSTSWPTWLHAARAIAANHAAVYPDWELPDWLGMAKRVCKLTSAGRVVYDYDMKIAEPFRLPGGETGFDLWPALQSLARTPTLIVRGGLSDLLSAATAEEMARRLPMAELVTLPRVGHAPTLDEPAARDAIDRLLARVAAEP